MARLNRKKWNSGSGNNTGTDGAALPQAGLSMQAAPDPTDLPLRSRLLVVVSVVLAHVLLTWSWVSLPSLSKSVQRELTVSVTLPSPPQPAPAEEPKPEPKPKPKPEPKPVTQPRPVEQQPAEPVPQAEPEVAEEAPVAPDMASSEPAPAVAPPGLPDRDPDYQAAYLKNPPPAYPMVARRMGWQGRVVLNVEVLASGQPGQVELHQSSGHDVLDNAAIKAVRGWRFVAARQGGQAVDKWFLVPIPFILKEAE